jgi:hypothetical protein
MISAVIYTPLYDQRYRSNDRLKLGCCWNSVLDRSIYLGKLGSWAHFQCKTDRTWNTNIIGHFITFLTRGRTQNFDFERITYDQLKLVDFTRYDFFNSNRFQVPFDFNFRWIEWFSKFILFMHMHMQNHDICRSYTFLIKRKACLVYKTYV